jgi:aspartyl-tRNA(Asn)/glutamyl-tRNA(Gln) amidotransferase subunit A
VSQIPAHTESELPFLSIEQAGRMLRRKEISPVELVEASLACIERWNPSLNAFITVTAELARRQARAAEREILRCGPRGPIHGIPVSLKDNFWTRGIRTTAGSKILADFIPKEDSDVAARLAKAGAILLGKTNLHEFAYGVTSQNPHFGPVGNPWALDRIPGGSSGGSAVAVAIGAGFGSIGTDTGGSIRVPAALCGIVGLKPTFGLISLEGTVPLAQSLDHAGLLARSVTDACILLESVAGKFPRSTKSPDHRKLRHDRPRKFRIGWPSQFYFDFVDEEVRSAIDVAAREFRSLGARIEKVSLPRLAEAAEPSTEIALAEATHYHQSQGYFPVRAEDYGEDVRSRIESGARVLAVDYLRGFDVKRALEQDFETAFEKVDAILVPASPIPAPRVDQDAVEFGGARKSIRSVLVGGSRPANFTGCPAISIPCGFTRDGLPIGLQLIGPRWGEARLLAIALVYEEATRWHERHPPLG